MRFVITESFDPKEVNRYFESEVYFRIGGILSSKSGKVYRVKDVALCANAFDGHDDIKVLVKRVR